MFLSRDPSSQDALRLAAASTVDALIAAANRPGPREATTPDELEALVAALELLPDQGAPIDEVLEELQPILDNGIRLTDPFCVAHLHPAPLIAAAVAELAVGTTNQSMDAFDASPAATYVEDALVQELARLHGLPSGSGVMTMGGTASNLLGLLLARDKAGEDVRGRGVPPNGWKIAASAQCHDSIKRSAALLGLGTEAVVTHEEIDQHVIAVVGTAGTTDLGVIEPLDALADAARSVGAHFHVDAAVGSGLTLSTRHRHRLKGIERADSVTADLHKLWWMPFGASALLVPDVGDLRAVHHASVYLNRPEDEAEGQLNLVGRSLDTSRRFDALKVLVAFKAVGRHALEQMVDTVLDLTRYAGERIAEHEQLELVAAPQTVMVAFRHKHADNIRIHRDLFNSGQAVIGRTTVAGQPVLKLTLLNPATTHAQVDALLELIVSAGAAQAA